MQLDRIQDDDLPTVPIAQPLSVASAMAYLKAIGLVTTLLATWVGLCSI
jgi:hypothetical protein